MQIVILYLTHGNCHKNRKIFLKGSCIFVLLLYTGSLYSLKNKFQSGCCSCNKKFMIITADNALFRPLHLLWYSNQSKWIALRYRKATVHWWLWLPLFSSFTNVSSFSFREMKHCGQYIKFFHNLLINITPILHISTTVFMHSVFVLSYMYFLFVWVCSLPQDIYFLFIFFLNLSNFFFIYSFAVFWSSQNIHPQFSLVTILL